MTNNDTTTNATTNNAAQPPSLSNLSPRECLSLEYDSGWLRIWLNRPEARNALSNELIAELQEVLDLVRDDREVRGITLRGRGGVFCAGGDLKGFRTNMQGDASNEESVARISSEIGILFTALNEMPQVVLILVEGAAMAGGLGIACCGDVVAVTRDAKFALTETTLGIPPAQIAPFVVGRLGLATARRLMLTAARFDGAVAGENGLADYVVDDAIALDAIEVEVRWQVQRCAPGANAITKEIVLATRHTGGEEIRNLAGRGFAKALLSEEGREGISAFLEKRKPRWAESS
ncbi:MAG: isohexenylglutaconyl-CoA hydratase [Hyphomicrobiaceae bacterium]